MVRGHHERWNGTGYPDGLKGEEIPMGARILAAADCLDALTSDRHYRRALPLDEALAILQAEAGESFDAKVVEILVRRGAELSAMVKRKGSIVRLDTDVRVERGDAPAAGFDSFGAEFRTARNAVAEGARSLPRIAGLLGAVRSGRGREAVYEALRSSVRGVVSYDVMVIYRRHGERMVTEYLDGEDSGMFDSLEIPMGTGLSGWVAENGKAIVNGNPSLEPGYLTDPARFSVLRSALAVPLVSAAGITGVLSLYIRKPDAFTSQNLEALNSLSPILAGALDGVN
jgi:GAF domain-containing protein